MAIAEYQEQAERAHELAWLPLDQIAPAQDNPRDRLTDLDGLAASIREHGLLSPVVVEPEGPGRYRLVAGSRRLAAAKQAGLTELPALVRSFAPLDRKAAMLVENDQRVNLTPLEEGAAYQELLTLGADDDTLARRVGRSHAEVSGRLAVYGLPQAVHKLIAEDAITYAEAALLTPLTEHPEDIDAVLTKTRNGWSVTDAVRSVQAERERTIKTEATRAKLAKQSVPVVDHPNFRPGSGHGQRLGTGWGDVHITVAQHRRQPCHAAAIAYDGSPVYVCTDPQRHAADPTSGVAPAPNRSAERAATRAANKAAREASTARIAAARRMVTGTDGRSGDAVAYVLRCVVHATPSDTALAALGLLTGPDDGDLPDRYRAPAALAAYAATDAHHALRAALAVHLAMAERDASAKHERPGAGTTVVGYLDLLTHFGHDEHPGDMALRARYQRAALAVVDTEDAEKESAD